MGWSEKNLGVSDGWPFNGEVDVSFPKKCSPWKKSFFEKLSSLLGRDVLHIGSLLEVISLSSLPPDQLQLETPQFLEKKTLLGCDKRPNVRVKSPVVKCWIPSCHGWLHLHVDVSVENLTALPKIPILVKNKELCHPKLLPPRILFITYWLVVWTYPSNFFFDIVSWDDFLVFPIDGKCSKPPTSLWVFLFWIKKRSSHTSYPISKIVN